MSKYYEPRYNSDQSGVIDCSSYVNWVLYRYTNHQFGEDNDYPPGLATKAKKGELKQYGFETIRAPSGKYLKQQDLKDGDIIICEQKPGSTAKHKGCHTEIYIGNGKSYSCGGNSTIKAENGSRTNFDSGYYSVAIRLTS